MIKLLQEYSANGSASTVMMQSATLGIWDRRISNTSLTYTNNGRTVERPGGISCYPAVFARINKSRCTLTVRLDAAPLESNYFSIGIATMAFQVDSSDGVGKHENSIGFFDDRRASSTSNCLFFANKSEEEKLSHKLQTGDIIVLKIDLDECWSDFKVVRDAALIFCRRESFQRVTGAEYVFASTLANNHKITIIPDSDVSLPKSSEGSICCSKCKNRLRKHSPNTWSK